MEIYVQSRGISKDYCWLSVNKNKTTSPELQDNFKPMFEMVDTNYFALVIYRGNGKLSLLVKGLKSPKRTDNRNRRIHNSVLWVADDSNEEEILRNIAIKALEEELEAKVDPAITENNEQGFNVNFEELKSLNFDPLDPAKKEDPDSPKIANLSACKTQLIDDLKKYRLPPDDGMLVVVCSTVSKSSLERENVWRGLSDTISGEHWINFTVKKNNPAQNFFKKLGSKIPSFTIHFPKPKYPNLTPQVFNPRGKWLNLIAPFILGLLLGIIGNQLWYHFTENQLQQKIQSLKGDITELEQEKNSLGKALKIKQQEIQVYEKFESESETRYSHFRD
ncbi:MAG: hypothetical protein ACRCU2_17050, partial [Planktothrix sp.]